MSAFLDSITHPSEILAMLEYKLLRPAPAENPAPKQNDTEERESRNRCYAFLNKTSRSFATVIKELDDELRDPVCLFYLILRGLDTVEDDMTLPLERKIEVMHGFHERIYEKGWTFHESGPNEKDRELLIYFDVVIDEFLKLDPKYQETIADITHQMEFGMAEFCTRRVVSKEDYNLYCHYVAGLVGIGLSRLFAASGLEDKSFADKAELSNSMGLFLQKTNIIRDFLEDHIDGRLFWPKEIWSLYCDSPTELQKEENREKALFCLNHMCMDAISHIPDAMEYLSGLRNQSVFNFCAIPQVMAIATLALLFNNPDVFKQNVKIRKGLACKLILKAQNIEATREIFLEFLNELEQKNTNTSDPNFFHISTLVARVKTVLVPDGQWPQTSNTNLWPSLLTSAAIGTATFVTARYIAVSESEY